MTETVADTAPNALALANTRFEEQRGQSALHVACASPQPLVAFCLLKVHLPTANLVVFVFVVFCCFAVATRR
jgi:hypothetical protein